LPARHSTHADIPCRGAMRPGEQGTQVCCPLAVVTKPAHRGRRMRINQRQITDATTRKTHWTQFGSCQQGRNEDHHGSERMRTTTIARRKATLDGEFAHRQNNWCSWIDPHPAYSARNGQPRTATHENTNLSLEHVAANRGQGMPRPCACPARLPCSQHQIRTEHG
jgi:hypothetical protein